MVKKLARLFALFFLVAFVTGAGVYLTFVFLVGTEKTVVVPNIVGLNVADGLELLTDLGLGCRVDSSEYSESVPKHHIITQNPGPGERIKRGRSIEIVVSRGTQSVPMPDLRGMTIDHARIVIGENGLSEGAVSQTHSGKAVGRTVIAQYPPAGSVVPRGTPVDILVSLGRMPARYVMPDMRGMSIEDAVSLMDELGLVPGDIRYEPTEDAPLNAVTDQRPCAGCMAVEGGKVDLTVNRRRSIGVDRMLRGETGVRVFGYRLANGFLNRHIIVKLNFMGTSLDVVDDYMRPGSEVLVAVPAHMDAAVFLYVDDTLVETRMFESW